MVKAMLIITTTSGEYILTSDLTNTSTSPKKRSIVNPVYLKYGKYFFAACNQIVVITQSPNWKKQDNPNWGVVFTLTSDLSSSGQDYFVYPNVINFLPGGISVALGTTAPKWKLLKSFTNSKDGAPLSWSEKITQTRTPLKRNSQQLFNLENQYISGSSVLD